jgi:predicted nucleotidyltransferase
MENIKSVVNSFLEPYKADDTIEAAILTGSYAQGYQNKFSDIDIFIVSSDKLTWRERGNRLFLYYMIEYFINPPRMILHEIEEQKSLATVLIIANSKTIFDKTGIVEKLKEKANLVLNEPIHSIKDFELEMIKYHTSNYYEQLNRAFLDKSGEFKFLYYIILEHIIYSYGKCHRIALPPKTKIYQYIFDDGYFLNKSINKINDSKFLKKLKDCMVNNSDEILYKNISELKDYFIESIGGFSIDGWKMRGEIK